jgi:hypothetical protein
MDARAAGHSDCRLAAPQATALGAPAARGAASDAEVPAEA